MFIKWILDQGGDRSSKFEKVKIIRDYAEREQGMRHESCGML